LEHSKERERQKLVGRVKKQAREVDSLKAEIGLLRQKGGHVYSAPPLPPRAYETPSR